MLPAMTPTTLIRRGLGTVLLVALGALALVGGYAETHRVPDQP
jgi:hypothetical protein